MSVVRESSLKMGVLDPIRHLCESYQLQFFIVLQNSLLPKQRFWSSSDQMNNLCGNLVEFATFVDTAPVNPNPAGHGLELKGENLDEFPVEEELKPVTENSSRQTEETMAISPAIDAVGDAPIAHWARNLWYPDI